MDTLERLEAKLDEISRILNKVLPVIEQHEAIERQREVLREEEDKFKSRYKGAFDKIANQGIPDPESCNEILGSERDLRNKAKQHSSSSKVRGIQTSSEERVG